ncbi:MATE family efflux transporter [Candidatus Undinarchaeota archaeon]
MKKNRVDEFVTDPKKALFTLAIPIVVAMLVQTLYNVVDTAFVGRLGADSIAALTFSFPLFFILIALNSGIGIGMASRISRYLGSKNKTAAENTAMHGIAISIIFAFVIYVLGITYLEPMFSLFGATESVTILAIDYMSIILLGIFFMFPAFILSSIFSAQGDTKTPMKVQITVLFLNMVLDPIFIYVLGYGVKGAAMATSIALSVSFFLYLYFIIKKSYLHIHLNSFNFSPYLIKQVLFVGAPASFMMLLMSVYIMFVNRFMASFGTNYVASFGLAFRLESLAVMPIMAIAMALMTLVGMFYGAKRYELLKGIIKYSIKIGLVFSSIVGVLLYIFAPLMVRIFTSDATLISLSTAYIRVIVFMYPFMTIGIIISRTFQGMGQGMPAFAIALVRTMLVGIPLAYVFVYILGYNYLSIGVAMVIGGLVSTIIAVPWLNIKLNKLNSKS